MNAEIASFNDAYKTWRNRARRYSRDSIIRLSIDSLQVRAFDEIQEVVLRAPWTTLLIVKWICQDTHFDRNVGAELTVDAFNDLRDRLWILSDSLHGGPRDTLPFTLFMRQTGNPQLPFQRPLTIGFIREAAILDQLEMTHPLREMFKRRSGLDVRDFMDLVIAMDAGTKDRRLNFDERWLTPLECQYSPETVSSFIHAISRSPNELISFCRGLPGFDRRKKFMSEYFEFTPIRRYPFLRWDNLLRCWHPQVFARGIEGFVHSVLSEEGAAYIELFSEVFEKHVVAETRRISAQFFNEDELRGFLGARSKVPDGLLHFPECNVFIESKAGLFAESVMAVGHSKIFADKMGGIREAVNQAWAASVGMRANHRAAETVRSVETDYLLVVTNKDVSASSGSNLASMFPEGRLDYPNDEARRFLPLEHVYVISVDDYERLVANASQAPHSLPSILSNCVKCDSDSTTSCYHFWMHLNRLHLAEGVSTLVRKAYDGALSRLEAALA